MPPNFTLTKEEELEVVKRYEDGESIRKLALDLPIGRTAIGSLLKRNNANTKGKGNSYKLRKYTICHNYFEKIDTEEKAYWLGFISADGHVADDGIVIALKESDVEHLRKFLVAINSDSVPKYQKTTKSFRVSVFSKEMSDSLKKLGFFRNKTETQTFPQIEPRFYRSFIRGSFDGDGCLSISARAKPRYANETDYSVSFCGTESFICEIRTIISEECNVNKNKIWKSGSTLHGISWSGKKNSEKILNWLYEDSNIHLSRKYQKYITI